MLEDLTGGSSQFDPRMALLMIQHPEMVVQHLASLGHEPPGDVEEGITHEDAGKSLGSALAYAAPQGMLSDRPDLGGPGPGIPSAAPAPSTPAPFTGGAPQWPNISDTGAGVLRSIFGTGDRGLGTPPSAVPPQQIEGGSGQGGIGSDRVAGGDVTSPEETARSAPTPAGESAQVDSGEPAKAGGDTVVDTRKPGAGKKEEPLDSLSRAIMGLKQPAGPPPLHVGTPAAPRASSQISRSNVPQVLMQEIAALGHPSTTFRLGEALRGKAFA